MAIESSLAGRRNSPECKTQIRRCGPLVRYDQRQAVPIERGENAGNNLVYHNVVRDMRPLGHWRGQAMQMDLSRAELAEGGRDGCAIIVQNGPVGPILAAARINF